MCPAINPPPLTVAWLNGSWLLTAVLYAIIAGAFTMRYVLSLRSARRNLRAKPSLFAYFLTAILVASGLFIWGQLAFPWRFAINQWYNNEVGLLPYHCVLTSLSPTYMRLSAMENLLFAAGMLPPAAGIVISISLYLRKRW